jgi:hypothetical protein
LAHFPVEVVSFPGPLADSAEDGNAAVMDGDVVNQLHDNHCFAQAGAAEKTYFSSFAERSQQVNDLDSGLKHHHLNVLFGEWGRFFVDWFKPVGFY